MKIGMQLSLIALIALIPLIPSAIAQQQSTVDSAALPTGVARSETPEALKPYLRFGAERWCGKTICFELAHDPTSATGLKVAKFLFGTQSKAPEDITSNVRIEADSGGGFRIISVGNRDFQIQRLVRNGKLLTGRVVRGDQQSDAMYYPEAVK